jgi:hypothetical protein
MRCFAPAPVMMLIACPCVFLLRTAPADANIVYLGQTRSISVDGQVIPNNHPPIQQSSSRSAKGFGDFNASIDADPKYQPANIPSEFLEATVHADMSSQLRDNQIIARGNISAFGDVSDVSNEPNAGTWGSVNGTTSSKFSVTFRTNEPLRYELEWDEGGDVNVATPSFSDATGRVVPGVFEIDGDPSGSSRIGHGPLPPGVYTLETSTGTSVSGNNSSMDNELMGYALKLSLSQPAIPLPSALLSGASTLVGSALLLQWRKRRAAAQP